MNVLLTYSEIKQVIADLYGFALNEIPFADEIDRAITKAQAKKLMEWGDEICQERYLHLGGRKRRECPTCWQALKEEIK